MNDKHKVHATPSPFKLKNQMIIQTIVVYVTLSLTLSHSPTPLSLTLYLSLYSTVTPKGVLPLALCHASATLESA